jgi:hygromycin-B 7''-O-kinase
MWPLANTAEQYDAIARDEGALAPVLDAVAARCNVRVNDAVRFGEGSLPVYALGGDRVLKLYPPCFPEHAATEHNALMLVHGKLAIPTPRVEAVGVIDDDTTDTTNLWDYILMSQLPGQSLALAWPEIPLPQRRRLMSTLGESLKTLHALPIDPGSFPPADWDAFISSQRETARERQKKHGLGAPWLDQIDDFLSATLLHPTPLEPTARLLHTEIMREHLLVTRDGDQWRLSGLFDFEPAMCGVPEYEFASAGIFGSCGDASLFRALLLAYGYDARELTPALSRRFLAYAILHRFSRLSWYLERIPPPGHVTTLNELAETWFGCSSPA